VDGTPIKSRSYQVNYTFLTRFQLAGLICQIPGIADQISTKTQESGRACTVEDGSRKNPVIRLNLPDLSWQFSGNIHILSYRWNPHISALVW